MTTSSRPRLPREVDALLAALQWNDPNTRALQLLSEDEWRSLLQFCDRAHLTLPLAQLPLRSIPHWVSERLRANLADNAIRFERVQATCNETADALQQAGVEHLVIKGFTQAPDYVPDPRLRQQSDLDLLCPKDQIPRAQAALESIGYRPDTQNDSGNADHAPTMIRHGNWQWRGNTFDPEMPLAVELHFCLWNEPVALFPIPETEEFWKRRTTRVLDGLHFTALHPVDHLGHLALHILRNILLRDCIVHHVYELATFLHAHATDDAFWEQWRSLHSESLRSRQAIAFAHAVTWFRCDLHPAVQQQIAQLPQAQRDWLSHFAWSAFECMFLPNKDYVWLHETLIQGSANWLTWLQRSFLPQTSTRLDSHRVASRGNRQVHHSNPIVRYTSYLVARSLSHARMNLSTLWRGLHWQLSRRHLAGQFWIFLAASFFFDLGLSTYFFLFNLFLIGHGYTERSLGLIASATAAGGFTGAIPAARLARAFGLRSALLTTFVLAVALFSARALLLALPAQLVLAFLCGITLSIWAVCISPAVAQMTTESQRPFAFSLVFSLGIGIGALGGLIGGHLPGYIASHHISSIPSQDPLRLVLLLSCAVVAIGIWPVTRLALARPPVATRARPVFLSPFLLRFLPAIALWSLVTGSFSPFANVYFAHHLRMSLPGIGNAFSLAQIAQVAAVLCAPLLFRRRGLISGIVLTQLAAATLLCLLASVTSPLAATIGYMGFTAFQFMNEPGLYSLLMDRVPSEQREGAAAANSLVISASQALASMLAGAAFSRFGYPAPMLFIAFIAATAAALFWSLLGTPQPHSALRPQRLPD